MQAAVYRVLGVRVELVVVLLDQDGYFKGMTRLSFFPSSVFLSLGSSTAGALEMATKRSLFDKRDEGSRRRRVLGV
jgi:hypothetical protein